MTAAVVLIEPETARTEPVPLPTEVTSPEDETVATAASVVAHVTVAPLIVAPFWSLTVAESCCVAPTDEKLKEVGDTVIEVATGVGGVGVVVGGAVGVLSPPHARNRRAQASLMWRIRRRYASVPHPR